MRTLKLLLLLVFLTTGLCRAQMYQGRQLVNARLLAGADGVAPGQTVTVGLELDAQHGWHTYWQYPGDAGFPTRIQWTLPPGWKAGPIQWPVPRRDAELGDIVNYVYPEPVLLPVEITAPADAQVGQTVQLKAHVTWLVCAKVCIPGKADVAISLPVVSASHPANAGAFEKAQAAMPRTGQLPFTFSWKRDGSNLVLDVKGLDPTTHIDFFPLPGEVQIGHIAVKDDSVTVPLVDPKDKAQSIGGLVLLYHNRPADGDGAAFPLVKGPDEIWQLPDQPPAQQVAAPLSSSTTTHSLLIWLGFGFLGGMILNVMPCVLPVIALKIFGFIRQAGESRRRILALGFTFVGGIFAWFLFLAGLIVSFKLAGRQLNWAFQFQHPAFVGLMVVILLLFSLNLLGIFEIVLPGSAQTAVNEAASREGYAGTFWHGVFATLMATPCTAPFLGPALGFALAQPPPTVFAMFGSIAAGMSAPYAVLAVKPGWLRYLPKPGIWMVRVKQALGVLLMATVVWLGWVLFKQITAKPTTFPRQLATALTEHKIVFVDFTAAWCVNCHVNERVVLDSDPVQRAFKQKGVIVLKADWTNGDEAITALLRKFGRAGVPCYVVYSPGGKANVLPEVITQDIVLNALNQAAG